MGFIQRTFLGLSIKNMLHIGYTWLKFISFNLLISPTSLNNAKEKFILVKPI